MTGTTDHQLTPPPGRESSSSGVSDEPAQDAPQEPKSVKRLRSYSVTNMVYSVLAVFALAFLWWALMPNPDEVQRRTVQVAPVSDWAAEQSDLPVWTPQEALGEEWSANFAHFQPVAGEPTWQVGMVTPDVEYVEISQTAQASDEWLDALLDKSGEQIGTRTITGPDGPQEWTAYEGAERAVVLPPGEGRVGTTVVRGTAQWAEFEQFIGLLEAVGTP